MELDFNSAHDILHQDAGSSENCPVCNETETNPTAVKKMAAKVLVNRHLRSQLAMKGNYDELSSKDRNNLDDSSFAYIDSKGGKHLPIPDAAHVRNALARFNQTQFESDSAKSEALAKIHAAAKKFGVEVGEKKSMSEELFIDLMRFSEDGTALPSKIQILPIGKWNTLNHGSFEITKDMLQQAVKNFKEGKLRAGVPLTIEHGKSSQYMDAAAGWFKDIYADDTGLWGVPDYTELGKDLLNKKIYKYISAEYDFRHIDPMDKNNVVDNVLTAATLTNKPLFRNLKPLIADEGGNLTKEKLSIILTSEPMNIQEILKKPAQSLTAEEKEFLKVHASELTEEQKKTYGFSEDQSNTSGDADKSKGTDGAGASDSAISGKEKTKTLTADEYNELMEAKKTVSILAAEKKRNEIDKEMHTLLFSEKGIKVKPEAKNDIIDFVASLNDDQKKMFTEKVIPALPLAKVFGEVGTEDDTNANTLEAGQQLHKLTIERAAKDKVDYGTAQKLVASENPELVKSAYVNSSEEAEADK